MNIKIFTFNDFQENTYVVSDRNNDGFIIDPGNSNGNENKILFDFIEEHKINVTSIFQTHCHLDHVFGLQYAIDKLNVPVYAHPEEVLFINSFTQVVQGYGISTANPPPQNIDNLIHEGEIFRAGELKFELLHCPGHSPGSLCLVNQENKVIFSGDVLFEGSIGRTDLPLGNHKDLITSIKNKLLPLDGDFVLYPGHGNTTTIKNERDSNPFF